MRWVLWWCTSKISEHISACNNQETVKAVHHWHNSPSMFHCDSDGLNCWLIASSYKKRLTEIRIPSVAVASRPASGFSSKTSKSYSSLNHGDVFSAFLLTFYLLLFLLIFFSTALLHFSYQESQFLHNWKRLDLEKVRRTSPYIKSLLPQPHQRARPVRWGKTPSLEISSLSLSPALPVKFIPRPGVSFTEKRMWVMFSGCLDFVLSVLFMFLFLRRKNTTTVF